MLIMSKAHFDKYGEEGFNLIKTIKVIIIKTICVYLISS